MRQKHDLPVVILEVDNIGSAASPAHSMQIRLLARIHQWPHPVVVETVTFRQIHDRKPEG